MFDRCVVTGVAGFIGSNLLKRLLELEVEVIGVDNLSTGNIRNIEPFLNHPKFKFINGDIRDKELLLNSCKDAEVVFHQAAFGSVPRSVDDPLTAHDINVNGTLVALFAAQESGVRRFINASSSAVYGDAAGQPVHEDFPTNPQSPYAATKQMTEVYCKIFYDIYGLETVSLRYFNVFGPGQSPDSQYAAVIPSFIKNLMQGEAPIVFGDGEQTRDFIFVQNVVDANILAATADAGKVAGKAINIGSGVGYSVISLLNELKEIIGVNIDAKYVEARQGDIRHSLASIELAQSLLGFRPKVGFSEGLQKTVDWFLRSYR